MKLVTVFVIVLVQTACFGQVSIIGTHKSYFGEKLELKSDHTFHYTWRFDMASSWTTGEWTVSNDTLYLTPILVFDTLKVLNAANVVQDTLVLSSDVIASRIGKKEFIYASISSGWQHRKKPPVRLYIENGKLFTVLANGQLDRRKRKPVWGNIRYQTYFEKVQEENLE